MIGLKTFTCGSSARDCSLKLLFIELISKLSMIPAMLLEQKGMSRVVIIIVIFIFVGVTILALIGVHKSVPKLLLPFILMEWIAVLLCVISMIGFGILFFYKSANSKEEPMLGKKKDISFKTLIIMLETVLAFTLIWFLYFGIIFLSFYKAMIKGEFQDGNSMRN